MFTYNIKQLPFVSMMGRAQEKVGWSHSGRCMPINLIAVMRAGECIFKINETDYHLKAGDVVLVPKNTYYKPHTDSRCEYTFFHFDGDLCELDQMDATSLYGGQNLAGENLYGYFEERPVSLLLDYMITAKDRHKDIELILGKCINTRANHASPRQILLSLHFSELLYRLSEIVSERLSSQSQYPQSLSKILYYINENYTENIQLDDIAHHTSFSKQYCMRLFKKYMNTTINDYVIELRMKHAAYLLRDTYMNVNEAADYLGFSSVSYFSRVFKKYHGVSPSEYSE